MACSYVAGRSARPKKALKWMFKIESTKTIEELKSDEGFETLNAKLRDAWLKVIKGLLESEIQLLD